jgi:simple sugar transport system permease protein
MPSEWDVLLSVIGTTLAGGTVIVLAAMGELLSERTGVMNLGLEGVMAVGAVTAVAVTFAYPDAYLGLAGAIAAGVVVGLLFGFVTVGLGVNQILAGLALTFFGLGIAGALGVAYAGRPAPAELPDFTGFADLGPISLAISGHPLIVYVTYLILPVAVAFLLFRTRHGLNLRASGENPAAADASGVWVAGYRFLYVCVGCGFAAAAGAYLTLSFTPGWSDGVTAGRGWIAIALVIFARWRPGWLIVGAVLFGAIVSLGFMAQAQGLGISASLLSTLPYLVTIALLVVPSWLAVRSGRRSYTAPASLGEPFRRGSS